MLITHAVPASRPDPPVRTDPGCRLCGTRLHRSLINLGCQPLADSTITAGSSNHPTYPLHIRLCDNCKLVQLAERAPQAAMAAPCLNSRSATAVAQARRYAESAIKRFKLNGNSLVIEVGSKDGQQLRHFQAAAIPVLGIEPQSVAAAAAIENGVPTVIDRFAADIAMDIAVRHGRADLVIADNVLQRASDLFDVAAGFASILRPNGVLMLQVPHLLSLVQQNRFDAFRHDCYSYLSLRVLERILCSVRLRIFDAEHVADHGGSLRVHACHSAYPLPARPGLKSVRLAEAYAELKQPDLFTGFSDRVAAACGEIRDFLQIRRAAGRLVAAYGAAAHGRTVLNACGIGRDEIAYVADPNTMSYDRYVPGSNVPIVPPEILQATPPHDILVLPGTDAAEVTVALQALRQRGTMLWNVMPRITRLQP